MSNGIIFVVNSEAPEVRVAEIRNNRLFDIDIERGNQGLGSIYRGVISNVVPGMEAFFIDIGHSKKGLLHFKDCIESKEESGDLRLLNLRVGQSLLVQVSKPAVAKKGPRLTQRLSLPGRYLVLISPWDAVGVSRRIESEVERTRLKNLGETFRPLDYGLIVRTEAEGVTEELIRKDVEELLSQIEVIQQRFHAGLTPELLHQDLGLLGRVMRDRFNEDVDQVVIDSKQQYDFCRTLVASLSPHLVDRIQYYGNEKRKPLFDFFGVEHVLTQSQQKAVSLPHGGSIVIEETEALTAIDVNTGKFVGRTRLADTVLQTNLEAVEEVALHLRLRGIGGIIVVDFIDMERTRDRIRVMDALEAALKLDHVKTHIVQLSPSGLVEITRQREGLSLRQLMNSPCPKCHGEGVLKTPETAAIQARRQLRQLALEHPGRFFKVRLNPATAFHFVGSSAQQIMQFEDAIKTQITVRVDSQMNFESTQIEILNSAWEPERSLARFTLGMHDQLFPPIAPEFAVWNDLLVLLPVEISGDEQQSQLQQVVVLEIRSIERWYATSALLRP